jgi:protein tyrosine phosphatase (PTP) superfamily phosphohydrolase (DUF442 family)
MFRLHWLQVGGAPRGMPRRQRAHGKSWSALGLLACLALLQSGCQSGPFSSCGSGCGGGGGSGLFGPGGFFNRVQARVFTRNNAGCCGPGVVSDTPVEYAAPVVAAPVGVPSYPATPGSTFTSPSTVPPLPPDNTPSDLSPTEQPPKTRIVPGTSSNGTSSLPTSKTSYQTRRMDPSSRLARRSVTLPRTQVSTPEPTPRSAQALARSGAAGGATEADEQDPLDHLPPLDLPGEVTRSADTPPVPPAASRDPQPGDNNISPRVDVRREGPVPAADDVDRSAPAAAPAQASPSASVGPGINRFVAVDLKLAGGSAPAADGLKWLVDRGYRTVLDLRESSEVSSSFITDATNLGLRYVALPVNLKTIDRDHVDRFNFEVSVAEARPLFFFDSDGTRAGALWYIRRIANDRVDPQIARREAQQLGLTDKSYWAAATSFVAGLGGPQPGKPAEAAAPKSADAGVTLKGPIADRNSSDSAPKAADSPPAKPKDAAPSPAKAAAGGRDQAAVAPDDPRDDGSAAPLPTGFPSPADPVAWRPFAAMVLTGMTVPLAYWSRTLPPTLLAKARASLPGPGRRPKSLPTELGA